MAWPSTALPQGVELLINGNWVDVSGDVYSRDDIHVQRGGTDEASTVAPASMSVTLDNRTYKYSPRNPTGPYFGQIGRNSKIRHWVKNGQVRLLLRGGDQYQTPDSVGLSITGDIDLRVDIVLDT